MISSGPGLFEDCLLLADDFRQYYLGGWTRVAVRDPGQRRRRSAIRSRATRPTWAAATRSTRRGRSSRRATCSRRTSSRSSPARRRPSTRRDGNPFAPVEGSNYAFALHSDASYMRLSKTVAVPAGATEAQLRFQLSINTEPSYDNVIVEARTVGQENWTTLPDLNGGTQTDPPAECQPNGLPAPDAPVPEPLSRWPGCAGPGTSGEWNSFTGTSNGWRQAAFDLTAVRRPAGRAAHQLRHRPGERRHRRVRGRHARRDQRRG